MTASFIITFGSGWIKTVGGVMFKTFYGPVLTKNLNCHTIFFCGDRQNIHNFIFPCDYL